MNKKIASTQILQGVKTRIRLMRSAIIKKARQDEQQNQTTTTNINYIQNFMSSFFLKKNFTTNSR